MSPSSRDPPPDGAPRPWVLGFHPVALAVAAVHFAAGFTVLRRGQPAEGAYVLFRYANQLAAGRGITYYPTGPRAEGAGDFAWMIALAVGRVLGLDAALGALLLNTLGAFLAATILASFLSRPGIRERWWAEAAPFLLLVSCSAAAGYLGFSSMLQGALALYAYWLFVAGGPARTLALPPTALLLGLFRPDSLLLGAGFAALGLWQAHRLRLTPRYLRFLGAAVGVVAVYVLWRWRYFGHLLPLHARVEGEGPLPALRDCASFLLGLAGPPLAVLLTAGLLLPRARRARYLPMALGLVPFGVHIGALGFGLASPDVASRAASPALLPLSLFAVVVLATEAQVSGWRGWIGGALVLGWMAAPGVTRLIDAVRGSCADTYVERFAVQLARSVGRGDTLALTEPGRLAYWTDARIIDLEGGNTPETAVEAPTVAYLEGVAPDVVMLTVRDVRFGDGTQAVVPLEEPLDAYLARQGQSADQGGATGVTVEFLGRHRDEYDVYAVRVGEAVHHVYGVRRAFARAEVVEQLLVAAQTQAYQPYLSLPRP